MSIFGTNRPSWLIFLGLLVALTGAGCVKKRDRSNHASASPAAPLTAIVAPPDTTPPSAPAVQSPATNPYVSSTGLVISGDCESGAMVALSGDDTQTLACMNGGFAFVINESTDGAYSYSIQQIDAANNISTPSVVAWILDSTAPAVPTITIPASSPHLSSTGLMISGACETGATVHLSGDDTQSLTCSGGAYSFLVSESADSSYAYSVTQTDGAGLVSPAASLIWNKDSAAPPIPTITAPSSNPLVSGDTIINIAGECETGATVNVSGDDMQSQTCIGGAYSLNVSESTDGSYSYIVSQSDGAGNSSSTASLTWIRDTTIPPTPTIAAPTSAKVTNSASSLVISGVCVTDHIVWLEGSDSQSTTCAESAFSFTVNASTDGNYVYSVSQENTAGANSNSVQLTWVRDATTPATPTITAPSVNPYVSSSSLTVQGGCEPSATLTVTGSSTHIMSCSLNGTYGITITEIADGDYSYSISQADAAGNVSATSASINWTRDSSIPATPTIALPVATPHVSSESMLTISGGCDTDYVVNLSGSVTDSQTCTAASFSFLVPATVDGTYAYSLTQTSPASIQSGAVSVQWTRDTQAPGITFTVAPAATHLQLTADFAFAVDEAVSLTECSTDGGAWSPCTSPRTLASLVNGSHTFQVRATDYAGNTGYSALHAWLQGGYNTIALYHLDSAGAHVDSGLFTAADNNSMTVNTGTTSATGVAMNFAEGVNFAGNGIMSSPDSPSLGALAGKLTAEGWIKFNSLPTSNYAIMGQHGASGSMGWQIAVRRQGGNYRFQFIGSVNGTSSTTINSSHQSLTTNGFYHVAVTFNLGAVKIYLNGAQIGSGTIGTLGSARLFDSTAPFILGQTISGGNKLDGVLDEIRISQIVRYAAPFTGSVPNGPFTAD